MVGVRVRLFLDVDGVINAISPTGQWEDLARSTVDRISICWSPSVVRFLNELSSRAEILWLTAWAESAPNLLAPSLGIRPFRVAGQPTRSPREVWWKHELVQSYWTTDPKPFIWIDDELGFFPFVHDWLDQLPPTQALAISPPASDGLCPHHLAQITEFVRLHEGTAVVGPVSRRYW
jgi:hypothetical protein